MIFKVRLITVSNASDPQTEPMVTLPLDLYLRTMYIAFLIPTFRCDLSAALVLNEKKRGGREQRSSSLRLNKEEP